MIVPLLDLKKQYQSIKKQIIEETFQVYESQQFILGPKVEQLENEIAPYCDSKYAVGVSSGTDALIIALMAADIGKGDEVITTAYTFFATAGAIARVGAVPVFADIDIDTYNIDAKKITKKITNRTKAIMPVHLYGQCCDMDPIVEITKKYDLFTIEDSAQAIGAEYKGRRAGGIGDMGCFSFFPSKNLGAFGDGGIVTTSSDELCEKLRSLRVHGSGPKYHHKYLGGNFRLDALQAAIVHVKFALLDNWTASRQANAERYRKLFEQAGLKDLIKLPVERADRHIYNQFVIAVPKERDRLREYLQQQGIGTEVYYPIPMHLQPCFRYLGGRERDFPNAEAAAGNTLALPIFPELTEEQQAYVVEKISAFYKL